MGTEKVEIIKLILNNEELESEQKVKLIEKVIGEQVVYYYPYYPFNYNDKEPIIYNPYTYTECGNNDKKTELTHN